MKLYYVAGPFSAPTRDGVDENISKAEDVGLALASYGLAPLIPHANTSRPEFEDCQPYEFWIAVTMELLRRCDAVVLVEGWERSSGARAEVRWAIGDTGLAPVRWWYRLKRVLTGTGRRTVYLTASAAELGYPAPVAYLRAFMADGEASK